MRDYVQARSDSDRLAWPIFLLLLMVLVPSLGVVWMMREAVRNERLATGQRLQDAYQVQLQSASQLIQQQWSIQLKQLADQVDPQRPAESFAQIVTQPEVDSALICDKQGRLLYPNSPRRKVEVSADRGPDWYAAEELEFSQKNFEMAADVYARLARDSPDQLLSARARQAQVRCLLKMNDRGSAIKVLQEQRSQESVHDEFGRSFAAAAELRLLEILDRDTKPWNEVAEALARRAGDYQNRLLRSAQRRFLMEELQRFDIETNQKPWITEEALAAEAAAAFNPGFATQHLHRTSLPNLWSQASPDGRLVQLLQTETIRDRLLALTQELPLPKDVAFAVTAPQESADTLSDLALGKSFAGWRLGLAATADNLFDETSQQRSAVHLWIALLVVALTCVLAWLLAGALRRRLRLARLKNDLVATVSHELKTPLASIRLLVDTLLDKQDLGANKSSSVDVRDYLELISRENARLTRLIDNFLQFSRMEQGKQRFEYRAINVQEVVRHAAAVFREHEDGIDSCLRVEAGKPAWISGDLDALVTALVNLLENAWKYSGSQKQIVLAAGIEGNYVTLAVQDVGIGLSARAASRVFERFYQVDQRVARTQGGCGLGLSIVREIVEAHGGRAHVDSQPNKGSTFTLYLPIREQPDQESLP